MLKSAGEADLPPFYSLRRIGRLFSVSFAVPDCTFEYFPVVFPVVVAVPYLPAERTEILLLFFLSCVGEPELQSYAGPAFFRDDHTRAMRVALFERIVHRQGVQEHRVGIEPPPGFAARNDRYVGFEIFPVNTFPSTG